MRKFPRITSRARPAPGPPVTDPPAPQAAPGRVLAIDPGERWIGLALSDDERRLGLPLTTIDRRALPKGGATAIADQIRAALAPDRPNLVVVGVPHRPDGREDDQAAAFRALGERIAAALGLPLAIQSERHSNPGRGPLTRPSPARRPGAVSPARRRRERQNRHALAAATILQRWLDAQHAPGPEAFLSLEDPLSP